MHALSTAEEFARYDQWVKSHPEGTLWQSLERKTYLEALGKEVRIFAEESEKTSALVTIDRTSLGLSTWEIPRGPIGENKEVLLQSILEEAKSNRCMAVYYSPLSSVTTAGAKESNRRIHCEATRIIDLTKSEDEILTQMKQKGRYNIHVAEKNGVRVERSEDIRAFTNLALETANRDGFRSPGSRNYATFLKTLPGAFLLLAYAEPGTRNAERAIAGLLGVIWNGTGIYYYGASDYAQRALMAPYLLQWEAVKLCKAAGCHSYDLLGIAKPGAGPEDSWSGITRFKEQFGGIVQEYPPEKEIVLRGVTQTLLRWKRKLF